MTFWLLCKRDIYAFSSLWLRICYEESTFTKQAFKSVKIYLIIPSYSGCKVLKNIIILTVFNKKVFTVFKDTSYGRVPPRIGLQVMVA